MVFGENKCQYCDPVSAHSFHFLERVGANFFILKGFFVWMENMIEILLPNLYEYFNKILFYGTIKILLTSNILKEIEVLDNDISVSNRTSVFIDAARKKGIKVNVLKLFGKRSTNFFTVTIKNKKEIFEILPHNNIGYMEKFNFDDKEKFKKILRINNFPVAEGKSFSSVKSALAFGKNNFPLVVKPRSSSLSKHVVCNIQDEATLRKSIKIVKVISRDCMVEKYIKGNFYRITLVNHKLVACCYKEQPNVIGDGVNTVRFLIEQKNSHGLRGGVNDKNKTLKKILITPQAKALLVSQDFSLDTVPVANQKVYMHNKIILTCGADVHDRTEEVHFDNTKMFEKISEICHSPIIGIDFICQDISISYKEQECAVLEANSLPYIDMHHYPVSGKSRDVGGAIVDWLLSK